MKPIVLVVLDGWGAGNNLKTSAIENAALPFYTALLKEFPNTVLSASGEAVGLPEGQMGNSEVGHLNLGAGRVVYQDYTKINKAVRDKSIINNTALVNAMSSSISGTLHLIGLVSDGGVHSHIDHLYALIDMALAKEVKQIFIHAFMDGRDTTPSSGIDFIRQLESFIKNKPSVRIATVIGRYWAMDRDNRWDRVNGAYNAIVLGDGVKAGSAVETVLQSYAAGETDEFIRPSVISGYSSEALLKDGDSVIFFNFRADRARELTMALTYKKFPFFKRKIVPQIRSFTTMTLYDESFKLPCAFPPQQLTKILGEVISNQGLRQLRAAETEKYAHVTYFFNGGTEHAFPGEDRCLVPSPKDVPTYDLKPEMSAYEVTDEVIRKMEEPGYDFVLVNYANPDMVGHTGIMKSAIKACEAIDRCLEKLVSKIQALDGTVIITADHGNCEEMTENSHPHTAHTVNPVPFILVKKDLKLRDNGILADVAPTVLDLMGIKKPEQMTGESLILHV
ncbi:MAG TPA: 2,3-bisphosphoglycerate-independent phosphoglycerate mutase [Nitrospirae bacterium]|nr:2,3-bisphosphoglycerate-independent phosphoglycerate mutase [Nitrospirota bacterium]